MKTFIRFFGSAWQYKGRILLGVIGVIGVNIFQFASITTIVPVFDAVLNDKKTVLPETFFKVLPEGMTGLLTGLLDHIYNTTRTPETKFKFLITLGIFIFCAMLLKSVFDFVQKVAMESVSQSVVRDFMTQMYAHIQKLPMQFFAKTRTGELISRIISDVYTVQAALSGRFTDNIAQLFQLPFYIVTILLIDWQTTLLAAIFLPMFIGPIIAIGRRIRKLSRKGQEKIADISSILQETISGVSIVRAFNMENYENARFQSQAAKFYKIRMKSVRREALMGPVTEVVGILCVLAVALTLTRPVLRGEYSPSFLILYCGLLAASVKPFRGIGKLNEIIQKAMAAAVRIYQLLDTKVTIQEVPGAAELALLQNEVRFDNVAFSYDPATPILKDINLTVRAGEMIAIVGPSGAGKTSFVNLIPRFYDVTSGAVLIDGMDIRDVTFSSLRGQIGIVTQETVLFNDTVRNNIAYGRADIPLEQVVEAARAANAHAFIEQMPHGYDTVIGERGVRMSGGERQRLAIARAILKNPRILIFDEATSSLDTESERLVQEAIDRLVENRTVFAIAHRLSTVQNADRIIVLVDGAIVQTGTHDELIREENGTYKKLYDMQFRDVPAQMPTKFVEFIKHKLRTARQRFGNSAAK